MTKSIVALALILFLAGILRFYDLSHLPNGLHWDEQDTGYQADSLIKTGRDYFGRPLPLFFHSFADWRTPILIYAAAPFVKVFGLTPLAVRLPSAISGVISVFLIYLLASSLFKSPKISRFASVVLALSPWHVLYNRQSVESSIMLTFLLLGTLAFYKHWKIAAGLFLGLAVASYSPAKFFVPLFLLTLLLVYRRKFFATAITFLLISTPILWDGFFGPSATRFHDLSIFTDPTVSAQVDQARFISSASFGVPQTPGMQPRILDKWLFNKPQIWLTAFLHNYFRTFSTEYLFVRGDTEPRHSPGKDSIGQLHLIEVAPFLLGLFALLTLPEFRKSKSILIFWLLVSPIPSALTRGGGPHAARTFLLLPALVLVIALGLKYLYSHHKPAFFGYCILYFISCIFIYNYFFGPYRFESAKPFQWGFDQAIKIARQNSPKYDHVYLDFRQDSPLMSYLFTTRLDPAQFQSLHPLPVTQPFPDTSANQFGNIVLLHPGTRFWTNIFDTSHYRGRNLIISAADQPLLNTQITDKQTISYPDSSPAFFIFSR